METVLSDRRLLPVWEKVKNSVRLDAEDGMRLYESNDLAGIGGIADYVRKKRHGNKAFYVHNRHINYTNICVNRCLFCAYSKDKGDTGTYVLSPDQVGSDAKKPENAGVREFHIVGGINPDLPFDYYLDLIRALKKARPDATVKAFTAVEIDFIARMAGLSLEDTIAGLKAAGLAMLPGGGAEVLCDRVRQKLFAKKISAARWLEVMETVHRAGLVTNATLLYGHIETLEERVDHLLTLRRLQDTTGGFSAFIPLAFHSANTKLSALPPTTAYDDLKTIAVARLLLDNIDHIKAYWVMIGEKLAQVALSFGADDLDGTIIEERITHTAGATSAKGLTVSQLRHMVESAGFEAVERDSFYRPVPEEGGA
ncbi:aminofutalosine synthase MqnE [Desulfosudis oleivorans]|uniref:Aminodeoxyfutalosine synthase n=1 Tax=Desulfosudis oleivorans (strain DSM 6200 / JCM 39069 / Hxd3) TaxID=96561 RepID=A8ZY70_DESOH|nr:aminofutalosine synthase MqnE [Desulfosudis oleivorans]ABW67077.1 Radical SAM domain protein [Desulfosudis oleivorans Hxd3]